MKFSKGAVNIFVGAVGVWGGPIGWVIAGTYFILNVSGAFGDWGVPSGISQSDYEEFITKKARYEYGSHFRELIIETDYSPNGNVLDDNYSGEEKMIINDGIEGKMPKLIFER